MPVAKIKCGKKWRSVGIQLPAGINFPAPPNPDGVERVLNILVIDDVINWLETCYDKFALTVPNNVHMNIYLCGVDGADWWPCVEDVLKCFCGCAQSVGGCTERSYDAILVDLQLDETKATGATLTPGMRLLENLEANPHTKVSKFFAYSSKGNDKPCYKLAGGKRIDWLWKSALQRDLEQRFFPALM